ncbi:DUF1214 domain-containing protein [Mycolicibacterium sp. P1-5]|uniref:DUF1214 domain-containing protein n=1 Tax=Mycolicibacterium sp. P1-5 TaxID=2024617 RepID=UPI001883CF3C|nr:DUF1214 domain-containing protein [Mycolicibacterium sp. P1-5]
MLTVRPAPGTADFSITTSKGDYLANGDIIPDHAYSLSQFTPNADGTYTIVMSPTEQAGNWINTSGDHSMLLRNTTGDWGLLRDTVSIHPLNQYESILPPNLSNDQIRGLLDTIATTFPSVNHSRFLLGLQTIQGTLPNNTFTPITLTSNAVGASNTFQLSSFGHYSLAADEALIIKVPNIDAGYTGFQTNDAWTYALPYATATRTLNNTQTFEDPDGFTYYVISSKDPGVANWIDASNNPDGNVFLRWQALAGNTAPATGIQTRVVNISEVQGALPTDTPIVTPAQRAVELHDRLLEWGYSLHQNNKFGWITSNLEFDQIKAAVGDEQFNRIFGTQQSVPSLFDRMTSPSLSPDLPTVARAIFANPVGSLAAVVNNIPLLVKDIGLPTLLAVARLYEAVRTGTGLSGLANAVVRTLTDPATGIPAGFLNARDDLAVALVNSHNYSPLSAGDVRSVVGQLAQFGQSTSQLLSEMFVGQSHTAGANMVPSTPAPTSALTAPVDERAATPLATTVIPIATPAPNKTAHVTTPTTTSANDQVSGAARDDAGAGAPDDSKAGKPAKLAKSPRKVPTGTATETDAPTVTTRHQAEHTNQADSDQPARSNHKETKSAR